MDHLRNLVLVSLVAISAQTSPIVIRTGLAKTQSQGQQNDEHAYDVGVHKGIANYEGEQGFNKNNEKNFVSAADAGKYGEEEASKKQHLDQNQFKDEKFHQQGGGHLADFGNRLAHKKGHHKSGFQNSYHKDETGSNSSFFDEAEDEGDQHVYKSNKGAFGDAGERRAYGGHYDSGRAAHDQARRGHYDNAGRYEKGLADERAYDRKNYYDGREQHDRRKAGRGYDGHDRYHEEQYHDRPYYPPPPHHRAGGYYYDDPYYEQRPYVPLPSVPDQRITIYEDPRYHDDIKYPPREDDRARLEIRRPLASNHDYRPYDGRNQGYYYDEPYYEERLSSVASPRYDDYRYSPYDDDDRDYRYYDSLPLPPRYEYYY